MAIKLQPLALQEVAGHGGFTHVAVITADHLTQTSTNTDQVLSLGTLPKGARIQQAEARLQVPFEDKSDAAFNSTTMIVGDAGATNRYVASAQLNLNGTEITVPGVNNTAYQLTADTEILATFSSMAAKKLADLDKGEVHIYLQILDTKPLSDSKGNATVAK